MAKKQRNQQEKPATQQNRKLFVIGSLGFEVDESFAITEFKNEEEVLPEITLAKGNATLIFANNTTEGEFKAFNVGIDQKSEAIQHNGYSNVKKAKNQLNHLFTGLDFDQTDATIFYGNSTTLLTNLFESGLSRNKFIRNLKRDGNKFSSISTKELASNSINFKGILERLAHAFSYHFTQPIHLLKAKVNSQNAVFRLIYGFLILLSTFLFPYLSKDFGISGDEYIHHVQAGYVYDYFANGDETCLDQPKTLLHYYGQSFDLIAYWFIKTFDIDAVYDFRHFLNSLTGLVALLFIAFLTKLLAGYRAAVFSIIVVLASPRFIGHAMTNPLDMPFTMGYIMSIYYMVKLFSNKARVYWHDIIMLGFAIGFTISIRVGGFILYPYLGLFAFLAVIKETGLFGLFNFKWVKSYSTLIISSIVVVVLSYLIGIIAWPFALESPLSNPLEALDKLTNISNSMTQLFEGENVYSDKLPWKYIPKFIFITTPLIAVFGIILFLLLSIPNFKNSSYIHFFLLFSFVFPIFYVIYKNSNVYGGWRHLLFVYPSMVVMAALGWNYLCKISKKAATPIIVSVLFLGLSTPTFAWMAKNHPFHYVYFNEFVGGVKKAYGKYELDYYFRSMKQAAEWLIENENLAQRKDTIKVVVNHGECARYFFRDLPNVQLSYSAYYNRAKKDWDYYLGVNTYINQHQLEQGLFPPYGTIKAIEVEGKPIAVVIKRENKLDYEAFELANQGKFIEAIAKFNEYLRQNPNSEEAYHGLSVAYANIQQPDYAIQAASKALQFYPDYIPALESMGNAYYMKQMYVEATQALTRITEIKEAYPNAYYYLAFCYYNQGQIDLAITYGNKALGYNPGYKQLYELIANAYKQKGNNDMANQYLNQLNSMK